MPRPRRSRRAAAQPDADNAPDKPTPVAESDSNQNNPVTTRLNATEKRALTRSSSRRDNAIRRLSMEDTETSSGADAGTGKGTSSGNDANDENNFDSSVEFGRKAAATPANMHHRQSRRDTTGLDLDDDDVFGALEDSFEDDEPVKEAPASGQRSTDTSSLTASVFKRRGRAPSISLHGNDSAAIRPSSRAGTSTPLISSSFNIGVFKRRAREPSILGTGRKERAEGAIELSSDAASSDDEELEGFAPEAESTPLNRRKTRTQPTVEAEKEAEKAVEPETAAVEVEAPVTKPSTRSRKRKGAEDAQEESGRPEKAARSDEAEPPAAADDADESVPALADANSDEESELSSLPSLPSPELPPLQQPHRPSTPINQSDIMAPPESSGSEGEGEAWQTIRNLGGRQRRHAPATPTRDGDASDVSSPPSLTHSPNFPGTRRQQQPKGKKQKSKASPKMTTADLANLLPRRRQKKITVEHDSDSEIDASGLAQDEDELGHIDTRASRRRRATAADPKPMTPVGSKNARSSRHRRRTYGRKSSDKENNSDVDEADGERSALSPMPDNTFEPTGEDDDSESMAEELRNAVIKFHEVDQWEMEFEETMHTSSPTAR